MQTRNALWDEVEPEAARKLVLAALDSFASVGYHASTTREIALRAGMSPAAVYVHFESKEQLLETVIRVGHRSALLAFEAGLATGNDPSTRVRGAVRAFAAWHAENQMLARVVQYELESLPGEGRQAINAIRAHFEKMLQTEIARGVADREFDVSDIHGAATAIFSLCIDVARWYSPKSRRSPTAVGSLYADLSVRMLLSR